MRDERSKRSAKAGGCLLERHSSCAYISIHCICSFSLSTLMTKRNLLRRLSFSLIVPVVLLPVVAVIHLIPTTSTGSTTSGKSTPPRQFVYYSVHSFSILPNPQAFTSRYQHRQIEKRKHYRRFGRIEHELQRRDGSIQSSSSNSNSGNSNGDSDWFDADHEIRNIKEQQALYDNTVFKSSMLQHVTKYLFQLNNDTNATSLTASSDTSTNDRNNLDAGGAMDGATFNVEPMLARLNLTTTRYMEMDTDDGVAAFSDPEGPTTTLPVWKNNETSNGPLTNDLSLSSVSVMNPTTSTTTNDIATTAATISLGSGSSAANMDIPAEYITTSDTDSSSLSSSTTTTDPPIRSDTSFMIAIPIRDTNEKGATPPDQMQLLTELESIQRAITYHCPILQPACIATTTSSLRIPLLSVTVPFSVNSEFDADTSIVDVKRSTMPVTTASIAHTIQQFVQQAVRNTLKITSGPITVSVSKLGIQSYADCSEGDHPDSRTENEVLYTVIDEPIITKIEATSSMKSTLHLHAIIDDIFQSLSTSYPSWSIRRPWDVVDAKTNPIQLRLPIMRLPSNWNDIIQNRRVPEESPLLLTSDQGGNGISPIFWISYSDDVLVHGLTLRQIAVYPCIYQKSSTTTSTDRDRSIDDRPDEQSRWSEINYPHIAASVSLLEDTADSTSQPETLDRQRLLNDDVDDNNGNGKLSEGSHDGTDGDQRERIMNIIESRAQNRIQQKRMIKVPGDRNPIFEMYRSGTLVPPQSATGATPPQTTMNVPQQPPFPNRELAVGFWSMIRSPTGFARESDDPITCSTSDNLILRVDGTIAGGPILDPVQRHKAAGGSWRYMEPDDVNNDGSKIKHASLQIRFIIPPKKDRVMVMEGQFKKLSTLSDNTSNMLPVNDDDATYVCSGNVWIEDATTDATADIPLFSTSSIRDDIGTFTIVKILNNSPMERNSQLTITIPKNVRYID